MTVQTNKESNTVESSLNKELDGFQRKIGQKYDILQESISKLTNQLVHQEEENLEDDTPPPPSIGGCADHSTEIPSRYL